MIEVTCWLEIFNSLPVATQEPEVSIRNIQDDLQG